MRALERLRKRYLTSTEYSADFEKFLAEIQSLILQEKSGRNFLAHILKVASDELNEKNELLQKKVAQLTVQEETLNRNVIKNKALLDSSVEAIFSFTPEGKIDSINEAALNLLGSPNQESIENGLNISLLLSKLVDPDEFKKSITPPTREKYIKQNGLFTTKDDRIYEYYCVPEYVGDQLIGQTLCVRDITEIKKYENQLIHKAYYDSLTNLPNRAMLLESIQHAVSIAELHESQTALLFIDLDDFKKINDTFGHQAGDDYLVEFTKRLKSSISATDTLGRLSGDEFVIVLEGFDSSKELFTICEEIFDSFRQPYLIDGKNCYMSCSIGISVFPEDSCSPDELLENADKAMYHAKNSGKNCFHFYNTETEQELLKERALEANLLDAVICNDFILHYQPKHRLDDNTIVGAEALIRLKTDTGELIYPHSFIGLSEQTGVIKNITNLVVNEVCQTISFWQKNGFKVIPISLNVSAVDFVDSNFNARLRKTVAKHGVDPSLIELEVSETAFFSNSDIVLSTVRELNSWGFKVSLDNFGLGTYSFSSFAELEVEYLKLDSSYTKLLFRDSKSLDIVKSIINLAINMGLKVLATGIENEEELKEFKHLGCEVGQGFLYGKPMTEKTIREYIQREMS